MKNPYTPPSSDVSLEELDDILPSKKWWKVFFWFFLVAECLSITSLLFDDDMVSTEMASEILIYGFIILGLFGFSYDKKIFFRQWWGCAIPVGLSYDLYSIYAGDWSNSVSPEELYVTIAVLIILVGPLLFFQYFALYKYCFKSSNIWNK